MKNHQLTLLVLAGIALLFLPTARAQSATATTTVTVTVAAKASITANATTALTTVGTVFADFTGTSTYTYKIRTTPTTGTGTITAKVTTDFAPAGGPLVATSGTTGDTLTYTCGASAPATVCSGSQTASTASTPPVATFGAAAKSATAGNPGTLAWPLVNDPQYTVAAYTATVTFTISAT